MDKHNKTNILEEVRRIMRVKHYSWWNYRFNARTRNICRLIDYPCHQPQKRHKVKPATIQPEIMGSDLIAR